MGLWRPTLMNQGGLGSSVGIATYEITYGVFDPGARFLSGTNSHVAGYRATPPADKRNDAKQKARVAYIWTIAAVRQRRETDKTC
ncbi:Uncharacterized protein MLTONO_p0195 (plasmid) [Mesorhizobium loti]|nr:Uncharacterized protein MLTONO_p0195 [Mesorhizobium loti]